MPPACPLAAPWDAPAPPDRHRRIPRRCKTRGHRLPDRSGRLFSPLHGKAPSAAAGAARGKVQVIISENFTTANIAPVTTAKEP